MNYKSIDISSWIQEGEGGAGMIYSARGRLLRHDF